MANLKKITKQRLDALDGGQPENNFVRASEYNRVIDDINALKSESIGTATAGNTATINAKFGELTSGTLTTAAATAASLVITNSFVTANSKVEVHLVQYSGTVVTNGIPIVFKAVPTANTLTITLVNVGANALNGTVKVQFRIFD